VERGRKNNQYQFKWWENSDSLFMDFLEQIMGCISTLLSSAQIMFLRKMQDDFMGR
jgi:hypothetical protein